VSVVYMAGRGVGSLAPIAVPLAAGYFEGDLARGMLVVVPAIALFLVMTLVLPETRRRSTAASGPAPAAVRPVRS
jgi:SHS family lactate transporter-like MFS transporter